LIDALSSTKFFMFALELPTPNSTTDLPVIREGLSCPVDYPPLNQTVFSGDKVAIAVQSGLPQPLTVLEELLKQLQEAEISGEDIVVVVGPATARSIGMPEKEIEAAVNANSNEAPLPNPQRIGGNLVNVMVHCSTSPAAVSYLAANAAGEPIYLNRSLVDADVVLPVGFSQPGYDQVLDTLYPEFSTSETQRRLGSGKLSKTEIKTEVSLANDTLGSFFSIQVVARPGGQVHRVISGERMAVRALASRHADQVWTYQGPVNFDIVVATVEGVSGSASWDDFVQAVIASGRISVSNAPIVVWSDLATKPGKTIRQALLSQFDDSVGRKLPPKLVDLIDVLQTHPIFLHSQLSRDEVESLGLGYLDSATQINRIGESFERGVLLRDAHRYAFQQPDTSQSRVSNHG
jgi:hypothetical protein